MIWLVVPLFVLNPLITLASTTILSDMPLILATTGALFSLILYTLHSLRKSISKLMLNKSMNIMLIILSIIFTLKNFNRIIYKSESEKAEVSLLPKFEENEVKNLNVKINNNKELNFVIGNSENIFFSNKKYDCVYSASPCIANQKILKSINIEEKYNYIILKPKN